MNAIIDFALANPWLTLFGAVTVVQIVPIKINPWTWLFTQFKKAMVGDIVTEIRELKKDVLDEKVNNKRWNVLDFQNSCLQGCHHTKEEWNHCLKELSWYENYCEKHGIPNGVMEEAAKYLRSTYQECLSKNSFL